jgi:ATP-dependent DNA ligase
MLQRTFPAGFIAPCLPTKTDKLPSGDLWLHEIKHDGFRIIARKDGDRVRLYSRPGNDLTYRFPLIVEAVARLRSRSCIIDGEAVCCDDNSMPCFDRLRHRRHDSSVFLRAKLDGADLHLTSSSRFAVDWVHEPTKKIADPRRAICCAHGVDRRPSSRRYGHG